MLSRETGHPRDHGRSPYGSYAQSRDVMFPVPRDPRYHPKMPTLGLRVPGEGARAYPASELARAGGSVEERFTGRSVRVAYDSDRQVFDVVAPPEVEVVEGFWFAWAAFHPESSVLTGVSRDRLRAVLGDLRVDRARRSRPTACSFAVPSPSQEPS